MNFLDKGLTLTVVVACLFAGSALAETASNLEWLEAKKDLSGKINSPDANARADACRQLARFDSKSATEMILAALDNSERAVHEILDDRATQYKAWEQVKVDWTVITSDQKERVAKYRAQLNRFAAHYQSYMAEIEARESMIGSLGTIRDTVSVDLLCQRLRSHSPKKLKGWVTCSTIAEGLATNVSPVALQTLIDLSDKAVARGNYDPRIAVRCLHALGARKELEAQMALVAAARSAEDWQVRAAAIEELGKNKVIIGKPVLEELLAKETGRLRRDAAEALKTLVDRRAKPEIDEKIAANSNSCYGNLILPSRNVVFVIPAGETMAWKWDNGDTPILDDQDNDIRLNVARSGVKNYLRGILNEYDELKNDPEKNQKKDFLPFRFNICIFRGYSEFFKPGMCEIESMSDVGEIEAAIKWMDWESPNVARIATGEVNLVEALDKSFHLFGFGADKDRLNFDNQPDSIVLFLDSSPTAGAFAVNVSEEGLMSEGEAWKSIISLVRTLNDFRQVQVFVHPIAGNRIFQQYVNAVATTTGGASSPWTPSSFLAERRQK